MGLNTALIIRNDFLDRIEKDTDFGKKIAYRIKHNHIDYYNPEFDIIPPKHADFNQLILIGGNSIREFIPFAGTFDATNRVILDHIAEHFNYEFRKKS